MPTEPAEAPEIELVPIPADAFDMELMRAVGPLFEPTLAREGDIRVIDLFREILSQRWQLWLAQDDEGIACACVTHIAVRPLKKVVQILHVGGRNMERWLPRLADIETWSRLVIGAARVEIASRNGWEKILKRHGYQRRAVLLVKDLP